VFPVMRDGVGMLRIRSKILDSLCSTTAFCTEVT